MDIDDPMGQANAEVAEAFKLYNQIPAFYVVKIILGGADGANKAANTQLRPEPFYCTRITWATTGDTLRFYGAPMSVNQSIQGATVECKFGDSFTTFLGQNAGLVTAVFGDSNGFLRLSKGILFQGSQPIEVDLTRLAWPGLPGVADPEDTRWDFVFHGVGLLPQGVYASGSAG